MLDYSPLWKTMKQKGVSQYQLINQGIEKSLLERLRKGQNVSGGAYAQHGSGAWGPEKPADRALARGTTG